MLEKFPNSQENVKLPFFLFVAGILVLGIIPSSAGMEIRVLWVIRIMVHSWSLGLGWGQHQLILDVRPRRVGLNTRKRGALQLK